MACATCNMIRGLLMAEGVAPVIIEAAMPIVAAVETKVKRKASAYSRRYMQLHSSV